MGFQLPAIVWVILTLIAWIVVWIPLLIPVAWAVKWRPFQPISPTQKLPLVASLYLVAPLIIWGAIASSGLSLSDVGLRWPGSLLGQGLLGLAIGTLGVLLLFGLQGLWGWVTWQWHGPVQQSLRMALLPTLILGIWVSATEEVMFRGLFQTFLQQDYTLWIAATIVSLIFALSHLIWEGQDTVTQLPGLWLMGMVLTLARVVDGNSLGLAWGLHAGWIWAMATLDATQIAVINPTSSPWLTGFAQKPLAGATGLLFLGITGASLCLL